MQLKKTLFLLLLAVGLFSGLTSLSTSVNANQQNNDEGLKESQSSNNLKTGFGKFKHTLTGTFDPQMQKTSSQKRKNNYQLIKTQKIKRQYFFFKNSNLKKGNLYSKNLKNKYAVKIKSFEEPMVYANQKMTLYNKKTHKYNVYYHVKSVNSMISGWTWNINLRKYQGINQQNKQILQSFKNVKTSLRMQVIVNNYKFLNNYDLKNYYVDQHNIKSAFFMDYETNHSLYKQNEKEIKNLKKGSLSYKKFINLILNKNQNVFSSINDNKVVGLYSLPKSSKSYGSFIIMWK